MSAIKVSHIGSIVLKVKGSFSFKTVVNYSKTLEYLSYTLSYNFLVSASELYLSCKLLAPGQIVGLVGLSKGSSF